MVTSIKADRNIVMHRLLPGFRRLFVAATGVIFMVSTAHAGAENVPLTGEWGGSQVRLQLTEAGGRLELACAGASIDGPVHADAGGLFNATGRYEAYEGGPAHADKAPVTVAAQFSGHIDGDTLHLSVRHGGDKTAEDFTLLRGRKVKLIRCA